MFASTNKSNELMVRTYSHLYNIPATAVYAPIGRPEMAYFDFTEALTNALGRDAKFDRVYELPKNGNLPRTYVLTDALRKTGGFKSETSIEDGLQKFINWDVEYYEMK